MTFDPKALVDATEPAELAALAGAFETGKALCWSRMTTGKPAARPVETPDDAALVTYAQAAELMNVSPAYVERLCVQGKLPVIRLPATDSGQRARPGRLIRIRLVDLREWLAENRG